MKRITAGLFVMALALSLILPTSVQGWGFTGEVWDVINDDVTYCFEGSLTTAQKNAVRPAVDAYDNLPNSELDLLEESCGIGTNIRIRIGQTTNNQLAQHTGQAVNGEYVTPQYVTIDVDHMVDIQWNTTHPISARWPASAGPGRAATTARPTSSSSPHTRSGMLWG